MSFHLGLICPHSSNASSASGQQCTCKSIHTRLSIWTAAEYGLAEEVKRLLDADPAKANALDAYGYSPLHYAAQRDHVAIVELLLMKGAQIDSNACGATALHRAAAGNAVRACELLINKGADVNAVDSSFRDMRTPLMKACAQGHEEVAKILLATNRVDQTRRDAQGLSAWDLAVEYPRIRSMLTPMGFTDSRSGPNSAVESSVQQSLPIEGQSHSKLDEPPLTLACSRCNQPSLFMKKIDDEIVCKSCADKPPVTKTA